MSIEKLILPNATASIAQNLYGMAPAAAASYALGVAELVLSLALLFGLYRTFSYGLSLLIHTVTVIVSWRELLDPWGLRQSSVALDLADLGRALPDACVGHLDHRWLASVSGRSADGSGNTTLTRAVKRARFRPLEDRSKIDLIAATQVKSLSLERIHAWMWKGRKTCTLEFMQHEWRSTE